MKKTMLTMLFLPLAALLQAEATDPTFDKAPAFVERTELAPKAASAALLDSDAFNYLMLGGETLLDYFGSAIPQISFGYRRFDGDSARDYLISTQILPRYQSVYGQTNWLLYPVKSTYVGIGLLAGVAHLQMPEHTSVKPIRYVPVFDVPLLCGYQFSGRKFVQLQISPVKFLAVKAAQYAYKNLLEYKNKPEAERIRHVSGVFLNLNFGFGF